MRLGARQTLLHENSLAWEIYSKQPEVSERHRHRYEINPSLVQELEHAGLVFSGRDETGTRMEIAELAKKFQHPYFLGICHRMFI